MKYFLICAVAVFTFSLQREASAADHRYREPFEVTLDYEVDPEAIIKITCTNYGTSCIIEPA